MSYYDDGNFDDWPHGPDAGQGCAAMIGVTLLVLFAAAMAWLFIWGGGL